MLHLGNFVQYRRVKQREVLAGLTTVKQTDDAFALDAGLQQFVNLCIDLRQRQHLAAVSSIGQLDNRGTYRLKVCSFVALFLSGHAGAEGHRLLREQGFLQEQIFSFLRFGIQYKVCTICDQLSHCERTATNESAVIETVEQIAADLQFLLELRISCLGNIHVAILGAVTGSVFIHCRFQCSGDANIVNDQAAFLILEHPVYAGNGLHKVVSMHGLVHIHRGQRRYIKTGQPHIDNNGNLHRVIVILELARQFFLV